jgi:hypothetical protein
MEVAMFLMRSTRLPGLLAVLALCGSMAGEAQARIFIGFGIPFFYPPVVVAPPVYYPPYYGPPPGYPSPDSTFSYNPQSAQPQSLTPPRGYAPSNGYAQEGPQSCQAGAYVCPLVADTPPGGACTCPGHNGQRIRGQAD